jgi:ketosteroid isomerase-like protein
VNANEEADMGEVDEFLAAVLPRQRQADLALLNGDSGPRKMLWSHKDPVTVLGAAKTVSGWPEVESLFDWLASNFSNGALYELDVTAASVIGDLGYVVGAGHSRASVGGDAPAAIALRVTLIFRREDGEWKEVHRHADPMTGIRSTHEQLGRFR